MARERPVDLTLGNALPLGSRIRLRRGAQGVRLTVMARDLGYDRGHLSHVENNRVTPSPDLLKKIADYLKVPVRGLQEGPIEELGEQQLWPRGRALVLGAPPFPIKSRSVGQRIERLITMAHLSPEMEHEVSERLVAVTKELLTLAKSINRHSGST